MLLLACGGEDSSPAGAAGAELTLESCEANVGDDVPAFFKTYFRCSDIEVQGGDVVVHSRGLPPHRSYYYGEGHPNFTAFDTSRDGYAPNPNLIAELDVTISVPLEPIPIADNAITAARVDGMMGTDDGEFPPGYAGVALDSVMLYNAVAAPGMSIEHEVYTFDTYSAHADQNGSYHYHTPSIGPLEVLVAAGKKQRAVIGDSGPELFGVMCDGTLVLGCTELDGSAPDTSDFDAQNGHVHDVGDDDETHFTARYHVHVCEGLSPSRHFTPEIQYYRACGVD